MTEALPPEALPPEAAADGVPPDVCLSGDRPSGGRPSAWRGRIRIAAGAALCVTALAMLVWQGRYRGVEAWLAGRAVSMFVSNQVIVVVPRQTVFFAFHGTGLAHMLGLQITLGCSSDLLLAPVVFVAGVMLCLRTGPAGGVLFAALMASWVVVAVNVLRLVLIAALVDWWGVSAGFGWGHTLFGSLLTLAGMAAALFCFVTVLGRGKAAAAV